MRLIADGANSSRREMNNPFLLRKAIVQARRQPTRNLQSRLIETKLGRVIFFGGNDQRGARFINQYAIGLIDDRVVQTAQQKAITRPAVLLSAVGDSCAFTLATIGDAI